MSRPKKRDQSAIIKTAELVLKILHDLQKTGKPLLFLAPSWSTEAFKRQSTISTEQPHRFHCVPGYVLLVEVTLEDRTLPKHLSEALEYLIAKGHLESMSIPTDAHQDFAYRRTTGDILYVRVSPLDNRAELTLHNNWLGSDIDKPLHSYQILLRNALGLGYCITAAGINHLKQKLEAAPIAQAPVQPAAPTADRTYTPKQVAAKYHVDIDKVYEWLRSGQLGSMNLAAKADSKKPRYKIRQSDLDAFEVKQQTKPPAPAPSRPHRKRKSDDDDVIKFF